MPKRRKLGGLPSGECMQCFWLHDHSPAECPYPKDKERNDCDAQSQYDPWHGKSREDMAIIAGNHSETQPFSRVGEWIKERNDLEPSN